MQSAAHDPKIVNLNIEKWNRSESELKQFQSLNQTTGPGAQTPTLARDR